MNKSKIEDLAEKVFERVDKIIPVDVIRAVRLYDLEVYTTAMEKLLGATSSGILAEHQGSLVIYINNEDSFHRQRFTIAHELGHFLLHKGKQFVDEFSAGETFYRSGDDTV